jgi:hypothetical protein
MENIHHGGITQTWKARYNIPKLYRPIVLINTMWKVLTAVIAEQITYLTEKF